MTDGLTAEVFAPGDGTLARVAADSLRFSIRVPPPLSWLPDQPNLYTLKVSTRDDDGTGTFGFRTIETVTDESCSMVSLSICAARSIKMISLP